VLVKKVTIAWSLRLGRIAGPGALGGEAEQQPRGIPLGGNRVRAGAALGD
jgi:hypothetical protein